MEDELSALVGLPTAPLKRLKNRETRTTVEHLLAKYEYDPPVGLRAYLSIGRTPPPPLVTEHIILNTLLAEDCASFLLLLCKRAAVLQADAALAALAMLLKTRRVRDTARVAANLARAGMKWHSKSSKLRLGTETVSRYIEVATLLFADLGSATLSRPAREKARVNDLFKLLKLSVIWASQTANPNDTLLALKLMAESERLRISVDEALSREHEFAEAFGTVWRSALDQIQAVATTGMLSTFDEWAEVMTRISFKLRDFTEALQVLYSDRGRFEGRIQRRIGELLGVQQDAAGMADLAFESPDSIRTTQLASALLRAWDAREEGNKATEAFEELRSILSSFFKIELRDNVGEVEKFNSQIHELAYGERPQPNVRLIRPRVEVDTGENVKVLIKSLVVGQG